jgi:non-heme chloroperoxidase
MIKGAELKVYDGAPHGLAQTSKDRLNADLLEFCKSSLNNSVARAKKVSS